MKVCPVCKSLSFDDAEVCYGCLHRFESSTIAAANADPVGRHALEGPKSKADTLDGADRLRSDSRRKQGEDSVKAVMQSRSADGAQFLLGKTGETGVTVASPCRVLLTTSEDGLSVTISVESGKARIARTK